MKVPTLLGIPCDPPSVCEIIPTADSYPSEGTPTAFDYANACIRTLGSIKTHVTKDKIEVLKRLQELIFSNPQFFVTLDFETSAPVIFHRRHITAAPRFLQLDTRRIFLGQLPRWSSEKEHLLRGLPSICQAHAKHKCKQGDKCRYVRPRSFDFLKLLREVLPSSTKFLCKTRHISIMCGTQSLNVPFHVLGNTRGKTELQGCLHNPSTSVVSSPVALCLEDMKGTHTCIHNEHCQYLHIKPSQARHRIKGLLDLPPDLGDPP